MVVPRPTQLMIRTEKIQAVELPVIDLAADRSDVSNLIVAACEKFGFFKVVNHGVPDGVIAAVEEEGLRFFDKPSSDKQCATAPSPFGYGSKTIGFNGDIGEVEYLLLNANDPVSIAQLSENISDDPPKFSSTMSDYVGAVRELACGVLDLMAEGLQLINMSIFSDMIKVADSDSVLRLNYYPPTGDPSPIYKDCVGNKVVGFGEHTDPQILTVLRSNGVEGLQISLEDGVWITVPPDPSAFWVNVGDALQNKLGSKSIAVNEVVAVPSLKFGDERNSVENSVGAMTNGRFLSVRHRALTNPYESRISMAFFAAPTLDARISSPGQLVTALRPALYRSFTWAEYKKAAYSLRLGDTRLNLFRSI